MALLHCSCRVQTMLLSHVHSKQQQGSEQFAISLHCICMEHGGPARTCMLDVGEPDTATHSHRSLGQRGAVVPGQAGGPIPRASTWPAKCAPNPNQQGDRLLRRITPFTSTKCDDPVNPVPLLPRFYIVVYVCGSWKPFCLGPACSISCCRFHQFGFGMPCARQLAQLMCHVLGHA